MTLDISFKKYSWNVKKKNTTFMLYDQDGQLSIRIMFMFFRLFNIIMFSCYTLCFGIEYIYFKKTKASNSKISQRKTSYT